LYEVYDLAVLTAATLSATGLSLTATRGEFVIVFHALRSFLTALLAMLAALLAALLAATISSLAAALLATASRCLLAGTLILAASTHVSLLIVLLHSIVCHCCLSLPCSNELL
jgi:hypothetical protein